MKPINGKCRSCGAPLIWLHTQSGKPMPVDAASVRIVPIDGLFVAGVHRSHFSTCKDAAQWRRASRKKYAAETHWQPPLLKGTHGDE